MRIAVSFCNQIPGDCGLAVIDGDQMRWAPMPGCVQLSGATGMTVADGRLALVAQVNGGIAARRRRPTDEHTTLLTFDESWNMKIDNVPGPYDGHDIVSTNDGLLLASTGTDSIWLLASTPSRLWSIGAARRDDHHVNGVTCQDGRIFASMFGSKRDGSWSQVTDGRVVEVPSGKVVVEGLHHPHSPRLCDDEFWVCDSGRGEVVVASAGHQKRIRIGGYPRGLWVGPDVALVGVSAARTRSRSQGTTNIVSDDAFWAGLAVVDRRRLVVTDRVDLSQLGGEVYDVLPVESFELPLGDDAGVERCSRLIRQIGEHQRTLALPSVRALLSTRRSLRNVKNASIHVRRRF